MLDQGIESSEEQPKEIPYEMKDDETKAEEAELQTKLKTFELDPKFKQIDHL